MGEAIAKSRFEPALEVPLRDQIRKLSEAINKRDLETIRTLISPSRIFVEIGSKQGTYMSSSQTVAVVESFIRSRSAISTSFDFVTDDGQTGSASGMLSAVESGRAVSYRLNFSFLRGANREWLLSKITMK